MEIIDDEYKKVGIDGRIGLRKDWLELLDTKIKRMTKCQLIKNKKGDMGILISGVRPEED